MGRHTFGITAHIYGNWTQVSFKMIRESSPVERQGGQKVKEMRGGEEGKEARKVEDYLFWSIVYTVP